MHFTRYQQEQEKRHSERDALAKRIAGDRPRRVFAAREMTAGPSKREGQSPACPECHTTMNRAGGGFKCPKCDHYSHENEVVEKKEKPPAKKEASAPEKAIANIAIHRVRSKLVEAGLHNISLFDPQIVSSEGDKGMRSHFIRSAALKISASIPITDGKRMAKKVFAVNVSFSDEKYSLDSLEKNNQVFAVNKASLAKIIAMEDHERDDQIERANPKEEVQHFNEGDRVVAERDGKEDFEGTIVSGHPNHLYGVKDDAGNTKYFTAHYLKQAHKREGLEDQFGEEDSKIDTTESVTKPPNTVDQNSNFDANLDVRRNADEDHEFQNGDKVVLKESPKGEIFTLSQWDGKRGWIGDKQGRGWYARGSQIAPTDREENDDEEGSYPSEQHTSEYGSGDRFGQKKKTNAREAQVKFPLRYHGHTIRIKGDQGGGHKALVYRGDELKYTSKRHADPHGASHEAKTWVSDNSPAKDSTTDRLSDLDKTGKMPWQEKKKGQISELQNPSDPSVVQADPEMEDLRAQAKKLQATVIDLQTKVQSYADALANKSGSPNNQGMMGLQSEVMRLQKELNSKLMETPANFVRFADQCTYAKIQMAKMNDPAWSAMISESRTRGKGVMKRVSQILDRISILFQKLTTNVQLKEYPPGALDAKEQSKILKKNVDNSGKIKQFTQDQTDVANRSQRYFLDAATGRTGVPGT
jgi:hypothetical protein